MPFLTSLLHPNQTATTFGQRLSDRLSAGIGSWPFILGQSLFLAAWLYYNSMAAVHWWHHQRLDPYPFILCNLFMSLQAAYTGPVVMMSQNRQAQKDRHLAELTYAAAIQGAAERELLLERLQHQDEILAALQAQLLPPP